MDNATYGLTKGQYSPTSPRGFEAGSTPYGNIEEPLNPIAMLIAYGASFVAQGYSGKPKELTERVMRAIRHKGFAFLNVISPCITFYNTYKVIPARLAEIPAEHDVTNQAKAFELSLATDRLTLALKGAGEDVMRAVFAGLSSRAAEVIRDELELIANPRKADIDAASTEVIETALRLEAEGVLDLGRG